MKSSCAGVPSIVYSFSGDLQLALLCYIPSSSAISDCKQTFILFWKLPSNIHVCFFAFIINSLIFILAGFPGLEQYCPWFSVPFSLIYAVVFLRNCLVLHVICTEQSLHEPMFYFLAMLALTDLCMGLTTVHTVLGILWGLSQETGLDACIA